MKAFLICLSVILVALVIGSIRQPHLSDLRSKLAKQNLSPPPERTNNPRDGSPTNHVPRPSRINSSLTPSTALKAYFQHKKHNNGVASGVGAVIQNQEAFGEIMKLDLAGQREFIKLVIDPNNLDFQHDIFRCEAINLCLCAMADRNPEVTLDYLLDPDQKIAKWYADGLNPNSMIHYALLRLSQINPNSAATTVAALTERDWKALKDGGYPAEIIATIAERDLGLALITINALPDDYQMGSWSRIVDHLASKDQGENKEQISQTINAIRQSSIKDPYTVDSTIAQLLLEARDPSKPWSSFAVWLDELQLTTEEANRYSTAIVQTTNPGSDQPEVAAWLAKSAAPSKERDALLYQTTRGYWENTDPEAAASFLQSQGIDPQEMRKLEQQGFEGIND